MWKKNHMNSWRNVENHNYERLLAIDAMEMKPSCWLAITRWSHPVHPLSWIEDRHHEMKPSSCSSMLSWIEAIIMRYVYLLIRPRSSSEIEQSTNDGMNWWNDFTHKTFLLFIQSDLLFLYSLESHLHLQFLFFLPLFFFFFC